MSTSIRFAVLIALLVPQASWAQQAQLTRLGGLPGGDGSSAGHAVSADGSVVVGASSWAGSGTYPDAEAFRWTSAPGMTGLGDLPGGQFVSVARAVNADGSVVVGDGSIAGSSEAFLWTQAGGMVGLGGLPGAAVFSRGYAVSADGRVVCGYSSSTGIEAFRWTQAGGMVGLGGLPGGPGSAATGTSADGAVVVGWAISQAGQEAFRWTAATGMVGLGDLPGGQSSSAATGVSADGSVIVGSSGSAQGREAFRWTAASGMVGLGDFPDGNESRALACSSDGAVVVGVGDSFGTQGPSIAFLWTAGSGLIDIRQELLSLGVNVDLALTSAHGVSSDGTVITGTGVDSSGREEAWLAVVPPRLGASYCGPATPNGSNASATLSAFGSSAVLDNDLTLIARGLPFGEFGYFLAGQTQGAFVPPGALGQLCLSGNIGRFNRPADIIQGPSGSIQVDLLAIPVNPSQAVLPGETWNFQCWFRDLNPAFPSNFSDAVSIVFH